MEKDANLKQLLLSASEAASPDFADAVMKKVNALPAHTFSYQPLVHPKWQRLFLVVFSTLIFAILLLSLVITLSHMNFGSWFSNMELPVVEFGKVISFLVVFWLIFSLNGWWGGRMKNE